MEAAAVKLSSGKRILWDSTKEPLGLKELDKFTFIFHANITYEEQSTFASAFPTIANVWVSGILLTVLESYRSQNEMCLTITHQCGYHSSQDITSIVFKSQISQTTHSLSAMSCTQPRFLTTTYHFLPSPHCATTARHASGARQHLHCFPTTLRKVLKGNVLWCVTRGAGISDSTPRRGERWPGCCGEGEGS